MTIVTTITSSGPYAAAAQTTFAVTFQSAGVNEIAVYLDGVLVSPTLYVFTRDADGTGQVVFTSAVTGSVRIVSAPDFTQQIEFQQFGAWSPNLINSALDRSALRDLTIKSDIATEAARVTTLSTNLATTNANLAAASTANTNALALKADLVGGLVPTSQIPPFDTTGFRGVVASEAAMVATTAALGNYVIRSDFNPNQVFYLTNTPATVAANWTQTGGTASVSSVNSFVGTVVLGKGDIGLANVDNTSDAAKPVSTAQATAIAAKLSPNGDGSALTGLTKGQVGLANVDNTTDVAKPVSTAQQTALDGKLATNGNGSALTGLTKGQVGLGSVDNTSDAAKPVSSAMQAALDLKAALTQLAASTGASLIGFIRGEAGAVIRTIQAKLRDFPTPEDFGAYADGTDARAGLLAAMQSGKVIDGGGRTYTISSQMAPTSLKVLRNVNLKWSDTTAMAVQQFQLSIVGLSDWTIENCEFDLGTVTDTGSVADSSRGGLSVTTSNPNVTFCDNVIVRGNRAKGNGNGTRIMVRSCRRGIVRGNHVASGQSGHTPDPTNDTMNGIEVTQSQNMVVSGNSANNLENRIAGTFRNHWSRGYLFTELHSSTIATNTAYNVDQGFDFSGAIVATTGPNGNVGNTVVGNTAQRVRLYGLKFANSCRYFTVIGNFVRDYGQHAFEFSGHSGPALADLTKNTSHFIVTGNYAIDGTGEFNGNSRGFRVSQSTTAGYPRGIRMFGNTVAQPGGSASLTHGFLSDVVYDGTSNHYNEAFDNKVSGQATAKQAGFGRLFARVGGGGVLATTHDVTATLLWTGTEAEDSLDMHSTATNAERITVPVAGWYRVKGQVEFAPHATGLRLVYLFLNGGFYGSAFSKNAISGGPVTAVEVDAEVLCAAGNYLHIAAYQNSGVALNVNRDNSYFSAEFVRDA